jgi:hypothetical protein
MSDRPNEFAEQLAKAQPVTRHLITSVLLDQWPNQTAVIAFGIASQKHYEALYYPIRNQEISPQILDNALGDGARLTAMTRIAPSNPHKDIRFRTGHDVVFGRAEPLAAKPANDNRKDRGGMER